MKIIVSSPSVAPHVQQNVKAYFEAGYLENFYTSFYEHPDNRLSQLLKKIRPIESEINRRSFHELPINKFVSRPFPELLRSIAARKSSPILTDAVWEWAELGFDKWVAGKLDADHVNAVHTYEHAALATLHKAKQLGLFSIYEQPSQHHAFFSRIAQEQISKYPELKTEASALLINDKAQKRNQRRDQELELAELILCNSSFTKHTLVMGGADERKISVLPLAFPIASKEKDNGRVNHPVVFLYAGNQSLRKATHLLFEAWRRCNFRENEAELWIIGKSLLPKQFSQGLPGKVIFRPNIPRSELMTIYRDADVFVFPSLADGFGMVVTEAMSQGLPVIASENSCGPDIIQHGKNGWLIPAGNIEALVNQLQWCVANSNALPALGEAARQKAAMWQWPQYRAALTQLIFDKWQAFNEVKRSV